MIQINSQPDARWPTRSSELVQWAATHGYCEDVARRRFAHCLALLSLCQEPELVDLLMMHGSAAVSYAFGGPRTPKDLDLIVKSVLPHELQDALRKKVSGALSRGIPKLIDDFDQHQEWLAELIKIDLYFPGIPTPEGNVIFDPPYGKQRFRTANLQSTIARKLLAMQCPAESRKDRIHHDLFDLAWLLTRYRDQVQPEKVTSLYRTEAPTRWHAVGMTSKSWDVGIHDRSKTAYSSLEAMPSTEYIPFEIAWRTVSDFYERAIGAA